MDFAIEQKSPRAHFSPIRPPRAIQKRVRNREDFGPAKPASHL
jgi:hypothetical protein